MRHAPHNLILFGVITLTMKSTNQAPHYVIFSILLLLPLSLKVKLSLCLTKHHAMKTYSGMEV